jgi:hypothetical protein
MKTKTFIFFFVFATLGGTSLAQEKEKILAEAAVKSIFEKKLRIGISGNQYWGKITGGDLTEDYFGKPCLGASLRAEYYPISFLGFAAGFGIQQRGAGIINPDNSGGAFTHPWEQPQYDGDSTYRQRLRFNTLELPIALLLRTPKDIVKGVRLSAAGGLSFVHVTRVNDVFLVVEDGYHQDQVVTNDYVSSDVAFQLSAGTDIDAGGSGILQVHLVYTKGTKNVYAANQGDGRLVTYGFRLSWLF